MLQDINPKLPMREKTATRHFYINKLGFQELGRADWDGYLMVQKDNIQILFFEFKQREPKQNCGQVYIRVEDIYKLYQAVLDERAFTNQTLGQKEFALLDPDK